MKSKFDELRIKQREFIGRTESRYADILRLSATGIPLTDQDMIIVRACMCHLLSEYHLQKAEEQQARESN